MLAVAVFMNEEENYIFREAFKKVSVCDSLLTRVELSVDSFRIDQ